MDFFTADPHFGHKMIIEHCKRPFSGVKEMDDTLVRNWNSVVGPDDRVWIIGDLAYKCSVTYAHSRISSLNGHKHLVRGNHDFVAEKVEKRFPGTFAKIYENQIVEIEVEDQRIVLCHYAMREWHHNLRGVWHLYGHTHAALEGFGKSIDVGVDAQFFTPVSMSRLRLFLDPRPIGPHAQWNNYTPKE